MSKEIKEFKINIEITVFAVPDTPLGFYAEVPVLKGCHSQGETLEELKERIQEAAEGMIEVIEDDFKNDPMTPVSKMTDCEFFDKLNQEIDNNYKVFRNNVNAKSDCN